MSLTIIIIYVLISVYYKSDIITLQGGAVIGQTNAGKKGTVQNISLDNELLQTISNLNIFICVMWRMYDLGRIDDSPPHGISD